MITAATATDVCFVHVLDDTDRSLTLAGATPPFDAEVGKIRLPLGQGISGWVASHREPVVISHDKESDPRYLPFESLRGRDFTSMVSVPMETDPGGLVGVLNVHTVERARVHRSRRRAAAGDRPADRRRAAPGAAAPPAGGPRTRARELRRAGHRGPGDSSAGGWPATSTTASRSGWSRCPTGSTRPRRRRRPPIHAALTEQLDKARELVDLTLEEARAAIGGLRPPVLDDLGLSGGLASLARSIPQIDRSGSVDLADTRLPDHIEVALYRIAQECLQNVVKHAKATRARLTFAVDRVITARWPDSKSSTTESVSTPSSIRWAVTRWAATGCCRWPNAPRSSAGGSTSARGRARAPRSRRRSRSPLPSDASAKYHSGSLAGGNHDPE